LTTTTGAVGFISGGNAATDRAHNNNTDLEGVADNNVAGDKVNRFLSTKESHNNARPSSSLLLEDASKVLLRKSLIATSGLLAFCVVYFFAWAFFFFVKMRSYLEKKQELKIYNAWMDCVKVNFDGVSDDSWISVCGEQASIFAARYPTYLTSVFLSTGQPLLVGVIFISQFLDLLRKKRKIFDREVVRMVQIRRSQLMRKRQQRQL
jgi:hypothetical protein